MKISEIFLSIQGEGKRTGNLSFFIRTNYCNLRCKFTSGNLCDSPYTSWYPEDNYNIGEMNVDSIIAEYRKFKTQDIVITGGEPVIQMKDLNTLCRTLKFVNSKSNITVETNGTFFGEYTGYSDLISISPKMKSSVPEGTEFENLHQKNRINTESLKKYEQGFRDGVYDIQWKFVINDENDMEEIITLQKEIGFLNENIYLMPEGIKKSELKAKRNFVLELCRKYKMNFSDRLQILFWENERGK